MCSRPSPSSAGKGSAWQLLAIAEQKALAEGAGALSVIVAGENERAARLYQRAGFTAAAREPLVPFPGYTHEGDWILLVKRLGGSAESGR